MKRYEYQVVRFTPDSEAGEFVNVGVLVLGCEGGDVGIRFIENLDRLSHFFPHTNVRTLRNQLRILRERLVDVGQVGAVTEVSAMRLSDASPFKLTPPRKALDLSMEAVLTDLVGRLLLYHEKVSSDQWFKEIYGGSVRPSSRKPLSDGVVQHFLNRSSVPVGERLVRSGSASEKVGTVESDFELSA